MHRLPSITVYVPGAESDEGCADVDTDSCTGIVDGVDSFSSSVVVSLGTIGSELVLTVGSVVEVWAEKTIRRVSSGFSATLALTAGFTGSVGITSFFAFRSYTATYRATHTAIMIPVITIFFIVIPPLK